MLSQKKKAQYNGKWKEDGGEDPLSSARHTVLSSLPNKASGQALSPPPTQRLGSGQVPKVLGLLLAFPTPYCQSLVV